MSAFEAFSSNLEAKPLRGSGAEPRKNFTKKGAYVEYSTGNLEAEP